MVDDQSEPNKVPAKFEVGASVVMGSQLYTVSERKWLAGAGWVYTVADEKGEPFYRPVPERFLGEVPPPVEGRAIIGGG